MLLEKHSATGGNANEEAKDASAASVPRAKLNKEEALLEDRMAADAAVEAHGIEQRRKEKLDQLICACLVARLGSSGEKLALFKDNSILEELRSKIEEQFNAKF